MRIRSIRPEFWKGKKVRKLSPWARLLLLGLNNYCDDSGRGEWDELIIKAELFPADRVNIGKLLSELVNVGAIVKYEVDGQIYLAIPNWSKLQYIQKPRDSILPAYDNDTVVVPESSGRQVGCIGIKDSISTSARFDQFWKAYPKKKSKGQAERTFAQINPDEQLLATMIATIERAKKSKDWCKDNGQFIPYPATWLNAKGWEDEIVPKTTQKTTEELLAEAEAEAKERQHA